MVLIVCGAKNFESENGLRGVVCTFKTAVSGFKVENVRSYLGRGFSA